MGGRIVKKYGKHISGIGPAQMGYRIARSDASAEPLLDEESECAICEKIVYETVADLRGANETL